MLKKIFFLSLLFSIFALKSFAQSQKQQTPYIDVELFSELNSLSSSSKELNLLLKITPKPNWHLYYQNHGDVGSPTEILTSMDTPNFSLKTPLYSTPKKEIFEDIITSYLYHDTFYILYPLKLQNLENKTSLQLNFDLSYNACNEECIHDILPIKLELPISYQEIQNDDFIFNLSDAELTFPTPIGATYQINNNNLELNLKSSLPTSCTLPHFISSTPKKDILSSLPTTTKKDANTLNITFDSPISPNGIILCPNNAFITNLSENSKQDSISQTSSVPTKQMPKNSFIYHIIIAFVAGLILNLMPCVLPVLSLKALHLIKTENSPKLLSSFAYMLGVITSFMSLAGILYYTKALNKHLGWGFQLQSIEFNLFLLFLFFLIFLNLIDKLRLPQSFTNFVNKLPSNTSFLTGFFAVIVATPCTGPFMGTAIGYALVSSTIEYFTIFLALSIGYALPYTLIELNPKLLSKVLPKTGMWMLRLKHFLSIPIALTCLWLGWVIYGQLNLTSPQKEIHWSPYSKQELTKSLNNNEAVFINFTAKWCLVCLLNDKTTLSTQNFYDLTKQKNIKLYKGDFTNKDANILNALKEYNRNSVPLYVYYSKKNKNPQILPQILRLKDLEKIL